MLNLRCKVFIQLNFEKSQKANSESLPRLTFGGLLWRLTQYPSSLGTQLAVLGTWIRISAINSDEPLSSSSTRKPISLRANIKFMKRGHLYSQRGVSLSCITGVSRC